MTFYDEIGGMATISRVVDVFYEGVADDELLRPMYPEEELAGAKQRLALFLAQYWGGPTTYSTSAGSSAAADAPCALSGDPRGARALAAALSEGLDAVSLTAEQDAVFWITSPWRPCTWSVNSLD